MTNDLDNRYGEIRMSNNHDQDVYEFDQQQTFDRLAEEQQARQGAPIDVVIAAMLAFLVLAIIIAAIALYIAMRNPNIW